MTITFCMRRAKSMCSHKSSHRVRKRDGHGRTCNYLSELFRIQESDRGLQMVVITNYQHPKQAKKIRYSRKDVLIHRIEFRALWANPAPSGAGQWRRSGECFA